MFRQIGVIEPGTLASLPLRTAKDAELSEAAASHVVTSFSPLHESTAAVATLPSFGFSLLDQLRDLRVFRTISRFVHLVVTECADFCPASGALCVLSSLRGVYVSRLYPFATFESWTVDSVLRMILLVLTVPEDLELGIEQLIDMLERNVLVCAALGWHMDRILYRHFKDTLETVVAHPM